jgi:hypothetical protein
MSFLKAEKPTEFFILFGTLLYNSIPVFTTLFLNSVVLQN